MKAKVFISILAVVALGLVIVLMSSKKTISRQTSDIVALSNKWVETSSKLSDLAQVHQATELDLQKRTTELRDVTTEFLSQSNELKQAVTTLARTEGELKQTEATLKQTQDEVAARDAKINALEAQNKELDAKSAELSVAITNLTTQIEATQQRLSAAEGDKDFLQKELNRLMAAKAELEKQLNDLQFLKAQVSHLKSELSIARRLEWIRKGLFNPTDQKGAAQLMQKSPRIQAVDTNKYDLNVEINSDGTVKVIPPITNAPAAR